ncbi:MAG: S8 family serine peptidase [Verrucomicrobiota bacterium]
MENRAVILGGVAILALITGAILGLFLKFDAGEAEKRMGEGARSAEAESRPGKARGSVERPEVDEKASKGLPPGMAFAAAAMRALLEEMLKDDNALRNEVILRFTDDEAYADFLARARAEGVKLISSIDGLRAVRLRFENGQALHNELAQLDPDSVSLEANYVYTTPSFSTPEGAGAGVQEGAEAVGYQLFERLGIDVDNSQWGLGVTIAIIDSGIASHVTFRDGQIRSFDLVGEAATAASLAHGTAVASLVAGNNPRAPGIAPLADLLDIRVLDASGETSSFQIAEALNIAFQNGAQVANLSLGSSSNSNVLNDVIIQVTDGGMVVVAAAGNDGGAVLYPAAYDQVIAVGSVDASGQHLLFSNSGDNIDIGAPGLGLPAAGSEGDVVGFSGTSSSAPVVAPSVAAVMSIYDVSATQAWNIIVESTVEGGAPGFDPQHGNGNLNLSSVSHANDPSFTNLAVASNYREGETLYVTVENRGRVPVYNGIVDVSIGSGDSTSTFSALDAGETLTFEYGIGADAADDSGRTVVVSETRFGGSPGTEDRVSFDNSLTTIYSD